MFLAGEVLASKASATPIKLELILLQASLQVQVSATLHVDGTVNGQILFNLQK